MPGKVLTVASGKGGVGKTTTAVNLAVALWREGNAVALVDADLGMSNLAAVLGLKPEATLHDVLAGEATAEEAVVEAKGGDLLVLPGERELAGFANADPGALRTVLAGLADRCDYVIVDTGAGLSYEDVLPLGLADEVLLVTTPDPAAIWDTSKTLELSGLLDGPVRGVVVTRALEDTDAESIAADIGVDLLVTIPEDAAVTESVSRGDPLESHAPDAPATLAYRDLAQLITRDGAPDEIGGVAITGVQHSGEEDGASTDGSASDRPEVGDEPPADADADDAADAEPTDAPEDATGADVTEEASEAAAGDAGASESAEAEAASDGSDQEPESGESVEDAADDGVSDDSQPSTAEGPGDEVEAGEEASGASAHEGDGDGSETDDAGAGVEEPDEDGGRQGRGGFFGWLGRLFS